MVKIRQPTFLKYISLSRFDWTQKIITSGVSRAFERYAEPSPFRNLAFETEISDVYGQCARKVLRQTPTYHDKYPTNHHLPRILPYLGKRVVSDNPPVA